MIIPVTSREEKWGRLVYDPEVDEFEAHITNGSPDLCTTRPVSIGCLVTGKCDLKCSFCYGNDESLPTDEITANEWGKIFRHLRLLGVMRVDLSGGEPTLRHDLPQIAEAAMNAELNVVISTNGRRLSGSGPAAFPKVRWHVSMDSGFSEIHEASRLLRSLNPSDGGFKKTSAFILKCREMDLPVRVLTCLGHHNSHGLFALGEHLASLDVQEWNISRILRAGRAQLGWKNRFEVNDEYVLEQVHDLRKAFPFIRIRYSNRTHQQGYFLLVLPDGSLATQYTNERDKVVLGRVIEMDLDDLQRNPHFHLQEHCKKWIAATLDSQLFHPSVPPDLWASEPGHEGLIAC